MATLNLNVPSASLNYSGAGTGPTSTRYVPDYTDQRLVWFKGVDNYLDLNIIGVDRRPVSILQRELTITMWDRDTGSLIFRRRAMPTSAENGQCRLTVFARDLMTLGQGIYSIAATYIDERGFETALTWNRARVAAFDIEVKDAPFPTTRSTNEITNYTRIADTVGDKWVSSAVDGPQYFKKESALFTVGVYASNWTGSLIVQGTLDDSVSGATLWADLKPQDATTAVLTYNGFTGIDPFNYYAGVRWIRVIRNESPSNAGTLDKVLIRV